MLLAFNGHNTCIYTCDMTNVCLIYDFNRKGVYDFSLYMTCITGISVHDSSAQGIWIRSTHFHFLLNLILHYVLTILKVAVSFNKLKLIIVPSINFMLVCVITRGIPRGSLTRGLRSRFNFYLRLRQLSRFSPYQPL